METTFRDFIQITGNAPYEFWTYVSKQKQWAPLDERYFQKEIPGYGSLNEKARKKARRKYFKVANIIKKVRFPNRLPNITEKMYEKYPPDTQTALSMCEMFEDQRTGYLLFADFLCAAHMESVRAIEPGFHPSIAVNSTSQSAADIFGGLMDAIFPVSGWHNKSAVYKQNHILDYRSPTGEYPKHIQDFTRATIKVKDYPKFKVSIPYADSSVLIVGADTGQIKEASSYLTNSTIILLNSAPGDLAPTKLSSSYTMAYDPEILSQIKQKAKGIASLFHYWQEDTLDDATAWARRIVQEARASFGQTDSRYIRVELDPKQLRDAIRYRVFMSFLDAVEAAGFMTSEGLVPYRQGAKDVFDPAPPEPVAARHAEDPDVFLETMKVMVENPPAPIIAEGERFIKKDKPLAAWRTIGRERYLVFLEADWAKTYAKAVRSGKEFDVSFFQREHWEREFQKLLSEHSYIKKASSGYRYRYDLLGNGTRDETYVLAIPAQLLED